LPRGGGSPRLAGVSEQPSNTEYRCPGEHYPISRAVHLARLGGYYASCRDCPRRDDTAGLSARQVRRLAEIRSQAPERLRLTAEGLRDAAINDVSPAVARAIAIDFARRLRDRRAASRLLVVFASDGRLSTAAIVTAVVEGIRWTGCEVVDLGAASAPCMAFAIGQLEAEGGVYLGNPSGAAHTLGMKFWIGGGPLSQGEFLDSLAAFNVRSRRCVPHTLDRPSRSFGPLRRMDAEDIYLRELRPAYHALRPLRFVLQCACEPLVSYLEDLLRSVACRVIRAEPGGEFGRQVVAAKAHFGMRIDGDGDSGQVFDEQGRAVATEQLTELFADVGCVERRPAEEARSTGKSNRSSSGNQFSTPSRNAPPADVACAERRPAEEARSTGKSNRSSSGNQFSTPSRNAPPIAEVRAPHTLPSDALQTLTLLLVHLSRDDLAFSVALDRAARKR